MLLDLFIFLLKSGNQNEGYFRFHWNACSKNSKVLSPFLIIFATVLSSLLFFLTLNYGSLAIISSLAFLYGSLASRLLAVVIMTLKFIIFSWVTFGILSEEPEVTKVTGLRAWDLLAWGCWHSIAASTVSARSAQFDWLLQEVTSLIEWLDSRRSLTDARTESKTEPISLRDLASCSLSTSGMVVWRLVTFMSSIGSGSCVRIKLSSMEFFLIGVKIWSSKS